MIFAIFCFFATFTVASSLVVILARNPIVSAVALLSTLLGVAGLFATINSGFIAIVQVLIYGGAVVTLFIFAIMLLNLSEDELETLELTWQKLFGVVVTGMILGVVSSTMVMLRTTYALSLAVPNVQHASVASASIGELLFTRYLVPFEFTSVLLLAAVVGVIALGQKGVAR